MRILDKFPIANNKVAPDTLQQKIGVFHGALVAEEHHRYRSWEHCYGFFRRFVRQLTPTEIDDQRSTAALQLGFYLASWGMLRPAGFLFNRAYTVHLKVVDCIASPHFAALWETEFGAKDDDSKHVPLIRSLIDAVRQSYLPDKPTDILVTKVILGTLGCLPACDRYFINGFRSRYKYTDLDNEAFLGRLLDFSHGNLAALQSEQARIESISQITLSNHKARRHVFLADRLRPGAE